MKKTILNVNEVAEYLKVSAMTIYRHAKDGKIPAFKVGSDWRFKRNSIDNWIRSREQANGKKR